MTVEQETDIQLADLKGWNMISLPLNPTDPDPDEIIGDDIEDP